MGAAQRLGEAAAQLDASRFVGRTDTLALIERALAGTSPLRLVYLHGPGGVGKSAVLRAVERRAVDSGHPVVHLDGRLLPPAPDAIAATLAASGADAEQALVIVDEVDELASLHIELRRALLATLAATSVVLLAGRRAPGREWFEAGLEGIATSVAMRPLNPEESRELLSRYQVTEPADQAQLVSWSAGYPLALAVAASLRAAPDAGEPGRPAPHGLGTSSELDDLLLERLGGQELAGIDPDILDVACLAPAVDARMLAAVLPGRSTRTGLTQLRGLSISEPLGQRTTLHRLARSALRSRLRDTDPDRYRTIVLRIADHLRGRALTEDARLLLEMAELIESPDLRVGFTASTSHYGDRLREGDLERAGAGAEDTAWFGRMRRWAEDAPQNLMTVRRATGELAALTVITKPDQVPSWAEEHIEAGPVLRHARAEGRLGESALMHDLIVLEDPADAAAVAEVIRVGNATSVSMWGNDAPRYIYVTATAVREDDGTVPLGYLPVPELQRSDDERELVTIMTDFGPDGAVGSIYGLILMEQQAEADAAPPGTTSLALVAALRAFNDDEALAASPLGGHPGSVHERAEVVRAEVRRAIDAAFGPSEADQLLRQAIERTYLDPDGGHGIAQRELHMSRSSFYRHLQRARQQLAEHAAPSP